MSRKFGGSHPRKITMAQQLFIVLRDAGTILVYEEIVQRYYERFDPEHVASRSAINSGLHRSVNEGMVWRLHQGYYQARPLMTTEEAYNE